MKVAKRLLILINFGLVVATCCAFIAPYSPPTLSRFIALCGLAFPYLLLANGLFILGWLLGQSKWAFLSLFTLSLGGFSYNQIISFDSENANLDGLRTLRVGTYNMQFSKPIAFADKAVQPKMEQQFEKYLASLDEIEVLGVQECGWRSQGHLEKAMNFPHRFFLPDIYTGIYSKHPIVNSGAIDFQLPVNKCLWADIAIGADTIRFYSAHLEPNRYNGVMRLVHHQEKREEMTWRKMLGILRYYSDYAARRKIQATMIKAHQKNSPYPSIIVGDFNDPPNTHAYHILKTEMQDTFVESGFGLASTINVLPGLRIDYILADNYFSIRRHQVFPRKFADHYLVMATLAY